MFQINRIEFNNDVFMSNKNNQYFDFPLVFDIGEFILKNKKAKTYWELQNIENAIKSNLKIISV